MRSITLSPTKIFPYFLFNSFLNIVFWFSALEIIVGSYISTQSLDEPTHQRYLEEDFRYLPWDSDRPVSRIWDGSGNAFEFLGHLLNSYFGNDQLFSVVSNSTQSIQIRHLLIGILGISTCLAIRKLSHGSYSKICLLASTILIATPVFKGNSFFNPKDIPFAAGFTFLWVAILNLRGSVPGARNLSRTNSFFLIFGSFLSIGTRPGSIPFILLIWAYGFISMPDIRRKITLSMLIGLFLCFIVNPRSWENPFYWIVKHSMSSARNNYWNGVNLLYGSIINGHDLPWWYIPGLLAIQFSLLLILLTVLSLFTVIKMNRFKLINIRNIRYKSDEVFLLTILVMPILLAIFSNSVLYNNARQLLFLYPLLAVVVAKVIHDSSQHKKLRWNAIKVFLCFSLIIPTVEGVRLFPYNYIWINEVARSIGTNDKWEFDYWALSGREVNSKIPRNEIIYNWPYDAEVIGTSKDVWFSGWLDPNFRKAPTNCELNYVTRPLFPREIQLSFYSHCTRKFL